MENKNKMVLIDCEEAVRRFNDFLDNYLKGKRREELMNHLSNCKHCFDRLEFDQLLKSKIAALGHTHNVDKVQARKQIEDILSGFDK